MRHFVVSIPLVVVKQIVVKAESEEDALAVTLKAPTEWFASCMSLDRIAGVYKTFDGVPMSARLLSEEEPVREDLQ